jgi:hypothetical protein
MSLVVLASTSHAAEKARAWLCREGFAAEAGMVGGASFVIVGGEGIDAAVALRLARDADPGCRPVTAW